MRQALVVALLAAVCVSATPAQAKPNRFDGAAAMHWVRLQLSYGPRPAGSPALRRLSERLKHALPHGHFQSVPGGLRNIIARVPGKDPDDVVVVGAHYDTKDIPGFLGANDGAAGTAAVVELARHLKPRQIDPTVVFALFDGEESPGDTPDSEFEAKGLRGSKIASRSFEGKAREMILLDFIGNKDLRIPREQSSDVGLWARLRRAAKRAGAASAFPPRIGPEILDDHTPFEDVGVPSIDLIDFDYPCYHSLCDDLSQISQASIDVVGETLLVLLPRL
ncbi:MAG TPA: M28 family metallopeptidase [Thermoleophilaceae bacterium]